MHAALQITEISEVVCNLLDQPTLARLARTCRAFEDPALDALWKVMQGLEPLARLLPDSMWILEDADATGFQRYKLVQPPSPEQWKLVRKYTSRMMVILGCSAPLYLPSINRLQAIAVHSPPSFELLPPLFPKLKAIKGAFPRPGYITFFYWLNAPSLTEMDISWFDGDLAIDFISDMGTIYPNMKVFSLHCLRDKDPPNAVISGLSKTIRSWNRLVRVELSTLDLDTAAYEHLMRLESLTSLTLRLFYRCLPRLRQAVLPQKPLPMLADLTLYDRDPHIPWMIEWLSCLHLSPSSLHCETGGSFAEPQRVSDLYYAIAAQLCHKSLERITVHASSSPPAQVDLSSIRPLFSFSRLRYVNILHFCVPSLSDNDLLELATSWPLLQDLGVSYWVEPPALMPTFRGFCHLLQHCPHLQHLCIVIDTRDSEWVDVARPIVHNHGMHSLAFAYSSLDDPKRVASVLCAILPSLKKVNMGWWYHDSLPEDEALLALWNEVNYHLGELRKCRDSDRDTAQVVLQPTT
ncbi:hypothetical protein OG21DRAFT_1499526 [Imleria badia]|nr:hypothetical protein OG21DRAFT_1499526 [Imleria badia]